MAHGIVVEHKGNGVRYAISERNFNAKTHKKVRDLKPGESVLGYKPRHTSKTEGSSSEGTKEAKKEGN